MPKNLEPEKQAESGTESGEEEEDASSSEEDDSTESDSEPERAQFAKKSSSFPPVAPPNNLQPQSAAKAPGNQPSSSDEDESATEDDEPNPTVKPIESKPVDNPQKSNGGKNPRSKASASDFLSPFKSTGGKRFAEGKEFEAKDAKRSKKKQQESEVENSEKKSNDDSKKQLFQRLWSEDDEIVVLKGMIDYSENRKSDPIADLNAFHDFIKGDLHVEVTRAQLQDKIRRLKRKFENNKSKEKDGKDRVFSKPHEHKTYELSKQIWGDENGKDTVGEKFIGSPKRNGKTPRKFQKKGANNDVENGDVMDVEIANCDKGITVSNVMKVEETVLRSGAELFEGDRKVEGEREWRKLRIQEMEVYLKKLDLMRAQTRLVLDVLKSSGQ